VTLLHRTEAGLPSAWYYDPDHYRRELRAIWYRDWVAVGRSEDVPRSGDYFVAEIGEQRIFVTRGTDGAIRAFHDTCRHRGSSLCSGARGRFANGRIVCPYHAWTYDLNGALVATPVRIDVPDFSLADYPLYSVPVDQWGGFVFISLAETPGDFLAYLGTDAAVLGQWPLESMVSVRRETKQLACNWKIYWENYSECYHCPLLHPELCRIVPVYRHGVLDHSDAPSSGEPLDDPRPRVGPGYHTWTLDGQSNLPPIEGPDQSTRALGMAFATFTANMFVVGHPDYVRSVRMLPRGPETLELTVDWLLPLGGAERFADDLGHLFELGQRVIAQDAEACERNQRGLKSLRHAHGVLVPQEQSVWEFHRWLRQRLA
jgi:Rieske 2Fe-2S family protein